MGCREQVTCTCYAYEFPHRISGGKCTGSMWAESYFRLIKDACGGCNCHNVEQDMCEVAEGLESIGECEGVEDHLHTQPNIRLPMSIEDYCTWLCEKE